MTETYTVLSVTNEHRIVLGVRQVLRLGHGSERELSHWASRTEPGVYRAWWQEPRLRTQRLAGSRLHDGLRAQFRVSPVAQEHGLLAKPASPSPYDSVRLPDLVTLLTDLSGATILEADSAAILGWDGQQLVLPPLDAPRVDSVTAAEVASRFPHQRKAIPADSDWPLLLLNAAVGTCTISLAGRQPFPEALRAEIQNAIESAP